MSSLTDEYRHISVLLAECLEHLRLPLENPETAHPVFVDATLGGAGHSSRVAQVMGASGTLIGIDQDDVALRAAKRRLTDTTVASQPRIELLKGNFGDMDSLLLQAQVPGVDAFLFDLGVSSVQIDTPSRGFSFKEDGPLDMRMDPSNQTITAAEIINTMNEADLARIIRRNSDEKWASRIAAFIVRQRAHQSYSSSHQLVETIKVADVHLHELIVWFIFNILEVSQITCIGQFI